MFNKDQRSALMVLAAVLAALTVAILVMAPAAWGWWSAPFFVGWVLVLGALYWLYRDSG
jgi:hypothetical protein